jgi:hypothetical protein
MYFMSFEHELSVISSPCVVLGKSYQPFPDLVPHLPFLFKSVAVTVTDDIFSKVHGSLLQLLSNSVVTNRLLKNLLWHMHMLLRYLLLLLLKLSFSMKFHYYCCYSCVSLLVSISKMHCSS